jgi:hypothetical protein
MARGWLVRPRDFSPDGRQSEEVQYGESIAELIERSGFQDRVLSDLRVTVSRGVHSDVVPPHMWAFVRPQPGSHVHIAPHVRGPAAGVILGALLPTAASSLAGALFTGAAAIKIGAAAFTIIGSLAINALIPPPRVPKPADVRQDDPNFAITGVGNQENRYGVFPTVLGRHKMFPPKTARGFTVGHGQEIYYHGRFTFGHGPVALETLKIGDTPITEFQGVQLEFLNVDPAHTLARYPQLSSQIIGWRFGSQPLSLYPDDVAEVAENARLRQGQAVVRRTRQRAWSASVDVSFQGLLDLDQRGAKHVRHARITFHYRAASGGTWIDAGSESYSAASSAALRFTKFIQFPAPGEYDIRVERVSEDSDATGSQDDSYLTAVRSVQTGGLPSHPDIAEMAIRIKASDQLNGQIETLNAVVQQLAPVWTGSGWTAPQPVRHPAWIYARALMGPMQRKPLADTRLNLQDLKAWADQEPHWTCDFIVDQQMQVAEVLDIIAGAGRSRRAMRGLKYTVIRDGGAGPIVQQFSPRNTSGFKGEVVFPKEIHGFRVRCISEHLDWQQDEIVAYADGYGPHNASEFETLDLTGIVLGKHETSGGNAWRLGRYHLAQALLRPERYQWDVGWDGLKVEMGDKVRLVHDVVQSGVGSGRVRAVSGVSGLLATFRLDEELDIETGLYQLFWRRQDGVSISFRATAPGSYGGDWTVAQDQGVSLANAAQGDFVVVSAIGQQTLEVLVTSIRNKNDLSATLTGVPAAPAVLSADSGTIPAYSPSITKVRPRSENRPDAPQVLALDLNYLPAKGGMVAIGRLQAADRDQFSRYRAIVINGVTGLEVDRFEFVESAFEIALPGRGAYLIRFYVIDASGRVSGARTHSLTWSSDEEAVENVKEFRVRVSDGQAFLSWAEGEAHVAGYDLRHAVNPSTPWDQAALVSEGLSGRELAIPAIAGAFFIKAKSVFGGESPDAAMLMIDPALVRGFNFVEELECGSDFAGQLSGGLVRSDDGVVLLGTRSMFSGRSMFSNTPVFTAPGFGQEGVFQLAQIVDLQNVHACRLSFDQRAFGFKFNGSMFSGRSMFTDRPLFGGVAGQWSLFVEVSHTKDDPEGVSPVWSDWARLSVEEIAARAFRFRVKITSLVAGVSARLEALKIIVDMPDRIERGSDIPCSPSGAQITFSRPFKVTPTILVTEQELPSGGRSVKSQVGPQGFHLQCFDAAGNPVAASFDFSAIGY